MQNQDRDTTINLEQKIDFKVEGYVLAPSTEDELTNFVVFKQFII